ncbi:MAG: serine/threonine protein kinase [Alphaproteobacteria bacterium]|nr:serine/threonine protein kinase [Alphaproteobacteria bacterium]MCB9698139.1 serine/threonine protein kinase [Alphaproteobacteria bacterium]
MQPVVGGYEVETFLRPGRFGDLWRARRPDGSIVELKLLKPELFKDGEAIRRFQREVRLMLEFEHPYLLRVLDHGTTSGGDPYLVLEHKEGRLLSQVVRDGALPIERVRKIGAQVARVLAAAATRGIVHRGLCPEAILLCTATDDVRVLDFGLALAGQVDEEGEEPRLTEVGQRVGDPTYMAPEYVEDFRSDARTDLYTLGVVLYELLTGDPPFTGRPMEVLDAHVTAEAAAPSTLRAEVPAWLDALVLALLRKDPQSRPEATAVARALVAGTWPPPEAGASS